MSILRIVLALGATGVLAVYLLVTAPPPLPELDASKGGARVPVDAMFDLVAAENDAVRALYTAEIVGPGLRHDLAFDERWRRPDVEAGPLPALFLRGMAAVLERSPVRLALFLGSDHPIRPENRFTGIQAERIDVLRTTGQPQRFFDPGTGRFTAMYADVARAEPCVSCHNEHPSSPKRDWARGDVMGATTWLYPEETVSVDELVEIVGALRGAMRETYASYLAKAATFAAPPQIGERWPSEGRYLPDVDVFMAEFARRASPATIEALTRAQRDASQAEHR